MPITGTVPITAPIAPTSEIATYPVTNPAYGLGGLRTVGTTADRNAITTLRREVGMVVYVSTENKYYHLVGGTADSNWQEFVLGGGAGTTGATGATGEKGATGSIPTDYVESLNSLTGPLQISAGSNIQITVEGSNTLVITSLDATFDSDITASFAPEKSFGKYLYGQRVPSLGKTAVEVIRDALLDSVNPLATLTSSSTVAFNQTAVSNVLNVTHTIRTIGATGATGILQSRRNNTGSWTTLNSSLFNPSGSLFSGSHTHTLTDAAFGASGSFNYRYIVFDSGGASAEATLTITAAAYQTPSGNLTQTATDSRGGIIDSVTAREKGNTRTTLSGTCSRTNPLVPITEYVIEYRENGAGSWQRVTNGAISGNPSTFNIPSINHTGVSTLNSVQYRLRVSDTFIDSRVSTGSTAHTVETETPITFHNLIWFGPTAAPPTTSNHVRAGGLSAFNPGIITRNPFILVTGTVHQDFVVALPAPSTISSAIDTINAQQDLKAFFLTANSDIGWSGIASVNDFANNPTAYNVYNYHVNIPYSPETLISVTRTS